MSSLALQAIGELYPAGSFTLLVLENFDGDGMNKDSSAVGHGLCGSHGMRFPHVFPGRLPCSSGQALIESCVVIAMICLIFFGVLQIAMLFSASEILYRTAACGARAKTVGLNRFMVEKSMRVASIPNAGVMLEPAFQNVDQALEDELQSGDRVGVVWEKLLGMTPSSQQYNLERVRIPEYLGALDWFMAGWVLDYANWDTIHGNVNSTVVMPDGSIVPDQLVDVSVHQDYPVWVPMHQTFYAGDHVKIQRHSYIENHYSYYLDDENW